MPTYKQRKKRSKRTINVIIMDLPWIRDPIWTHTVARDEAAALPKVLFGQLTVGKRIGSDSSNGRAYLATAGSNAYVLKVIPSGETEIEIAIRLGEMAKKNPDFPYPITYGSGRLPHDKLKAFGVSKDATYLVSEVASGDVAQFFKEAREANERGLLSSWAKTHMPLLFPTGVESIQEWKKEVAFHAYCCLKKLHAHGYAHRDAHQGNFLVLKSGKIVIHDFGTTTPVDTDGVAEDNRLFSLHFANWGIPSNIAKLSTSCQFYCVDHAVAPPHYTIYKEFLSPANRKRRRGPQS